MDIAVTPTELLPISESRGDIWVGSSGQVNWPWSGHASPCCGQCHGIASIRGIAGSVESAGSDLAEAANTLPGESVQLVEHLRLQRRFPHERTER